MADPLGRLRKALGERYEVERELGSGGMATVYVARDLKHDRAVAVKVLEPQLEIGPQRFRREIALVAGLHHPHILQLYDSGDADGLLFYVMPYLPEDNLEAKLAREGRLGLDEALQLAGEVAEALDYAHRQGVIHRDVKPANILLEDAHAMLSDFGLAHAQSFSDPGITTPGVAVGTPLYMSPEQVYGDADVDGRTDIYGLGCVLYQMLAGRPPYGGPSVRIILAKRLSGPPPRLTGIRDDVPEAVDEVVYKALAMKPEDRFRTADDFARALEAIRTGTSSTFRAYITPDPARLGRRSIAVLPFVNMSDDPENEYFTDGVTEDVINALTKLPELRVASRTSAFAFKGQNTNIQIIGRQLNVGTVMEGSVRRSADRIRINAQLVNVADGYQLWSEQFDRELHDVFAVQDEISRAIVDELRCELGIGREPAPLVRPQTQDMDAYDLYLKGRYFWNRRGDGLLQARDLFAQAIEKDAEYAPAHVGLSDAFVLLGWYRALPPQEAFPPARAAARRALELDDSLAEAHTSLAFELMCHEWAWESAEAEFIRAIELNPGYATTHHWYAEYLMAMGRQDEAVDHAMRAGELDPLGLIIKVVASMAHYFARDYERAIGYALKTLDMEPSFTPAHIWLGLAYMAAGEGEESMRVFEHERALAPDRPTTSAFLGAAYARFGRQPEAEDISRQLRSARQSRYVSYFDLALIELHLGRRQAALDLLEQAHAERACWLAWAKVDPLLDPLREEPRFESLLGKMVLR